jgi:hypothetical protein
MYVQHRELLLWQCCGAYMNCCHVLLLLPPPPLLLLLLLQS